MNPAFWTSNCAVRLLPAGYTENRFVLGSWAATSQHLEELEQTQAATQASLEAQTVQCKALAEALALETAALQALRAQTRAESSDTEAPAERRVAEEEQSSHLSEEQAAVSISVCGLASFGMH